MTLSDRDIDNIQAARDRIRKLGKTSRAQETLAVYQAFKGRYTLAQVEFALSEVTA